MKLMTKEWKNACLLSNADVVGNIIALLTVTDLKAWSDQLLIWFVSILRLRKEELKAFVLGQAATRGIEVVAF